MRKMIILFLFLMLFGFTTAADEIQVGYTPDNTLYFRVRNSAGQVWDTSGTPAFESWSDGNVTDYDVALTDDSGGHYRGTFPATISLGRYSVDVFLQIGATPAITDILVGPDEMVWNGSEERRAAVAIYDPKVRYVAKTGNDGNGGHSPDDAYLTIGQAVTDGADGDKIIIYPGTYDEKIDLDTANKGMELEGISRRGTRIVPSTTGVGITLENNSTVRNLTVVSTADDNAVGISASTKDDILVENCYISGAYDGIALSGERHMIRGCYVRGTYDGVNINVENFEILDSIFETDGTNTSAYSRAGVFTEHGVVSNCVFRAYKTSSAYDVGGVQVWQSTNTLVTFNNCVFHAVGSGTHSGDAFGLEATGAGVIVNITGGGAHSVEVGAGSSYDLRQLTSSTIKVSNVAYSTTSGTISLIGTNVTQVNGTVQTANDNGADINTLIIEVGTAGDGLTNINLPNQTMDITGNLSGSVGSLTGHTNQTGDTYALANGAAGFSAINTDVEAIMERTDNLPDDPADDSDVDTQLADIPTVAEFDARTIVSGSYFDPANDAVAVVTSVTTTTTNTDMVSEPPTVAEIQAELEEDGASMLDTLVDNQGDWATATGFATSAALATIDGKIDTVDNFLDTEIDWLLDVAESDSYIDTATTPWQLVTHMKGDAGTELMRKDLFDVSGGNVTSTTTVIGRHLEP